MRKVHLLLIGLLTMASTSIAAVPQAHAPVTVAPPAVVATANANTTTAPAAVPMTLADVFAPATPAQHACNLLCIQGYHCCVVGNNSECIPNDQSCP